MTHSPLCTCLSIPESDGLGSTGCTCYPYCGQLKQQDFHTAHTLTLSSCEGPQNSLHSHLNEKYTGHTVIITNCRCHPSTQLFKRLYFEANQNQCIFTSVFYERLML